MGLKLQGPTQEYNFYPRRNRTIVGLKQLRTIYDSRTSHLSQSHHSGIETEQGEDLLFFQRRRNRTIVGLKPSIVCELEEVFAGRNRTIVGLKLKDKIYR